MNLLNVFLIGLLATYCITFMLNELRGPGDIFGRFRTWIGVTYDEHSRPQATNWRAEAVMCFYCLSIWIGGFVTLLIAAVLLLMHVVLTPDLLIGLVLMPFAFSGGASFLKKWTG